jgi:hypothetical protein
MIVSLQDMKDFLGEDGTASDAIITDLIKSAEEEISVSTGIPIASSTMAETAKRAVRIMVWLSFYADRDSTKNTEYLVTEKTRLIMKLKWGDIPAAT